MKFKDFQPGQIKMEAICSFLWGINKHHMDPGFFVNGKTEVNGVGNISASHTDRTQCHRALRTSVCFPVSPQGSLAVGGEDTG